MTYPLKGFYFLTCLLLFLIVYSSSLYPQNDSYFESLVGKENYDQLIKQGEVTSSFKATQPLKLIPATKNQEEKIAHLFKTKPSIGVEILMLLSDDRFSNLESPENLLKIYNILHTISSLKGILYFSASRNKMRIFFQNAYVVNSLENKKALVDPVLNELKSNDSLKAFIDDSSFGTYVCSINYQYESESSLISMYMENLTKIYYFLVPVVDPGNLKFYFELFPYKNQILFYGFTSVNTVDPLGLAENKLASFYNRIKAMYNWFKTGMEKSF